MNDSTSQVATNMKQTPSQKLAAWQPRTRGAIVNRSLLIWLITAIVVLVPSALCSVLFHSPAGVILGACLLAFLSFRILGVGVDLVQPIDSDWFNQLAVQLECLALIGDHQDKMVVGAIVDLVEKAAPLYEADARRLNNLLHARLKEVRAAMTPLFANDVEANRALGRSLSQFGEAYATAHKEFSERMAALPTAKA